MRFCFVPYTGELLQCSTAIPLHWLTDWLLLKPKAQRTFMDEAKERLPLVLSLPGALLDSFVGSLLTTGTPFFSSGLWSPVNLLCMSPDLVPMYEPSFLIISMPYSDHCVSGLLIQLQNLDLQLLGSVTAQSTWLEHLLPPA